MFAYAQKEPIKKSVQNQTSKTTTQFTQIPIQTKSLFSFEPLDKHVIQMQRIDSTMSLLSGFIKKIEIEHLFEDPQVAFLCSEIDSLLSRLHVELKQNKSLQEPVISPEEHGYSISYNPAKMAENPHKTLAFLLHELTHVAVDQAYNRDTVAKGKDIPGEFFNMEITDDKKENTSRLTAITTYVDNQIVPLITESLESDRKEIDKSDHEHITKRLSYLQGKPHNELDTVLTDMLIYLGFKRYNLTKTYGFISALVRMRQKKREEQREYMY